MGVERRPQRGALIVLEGCDRAGKSTQAKIIAEELKKDNVSIQNMAFPNRTTTTGLKINNYLKGIENISDDQVVHKLFSENRKEVQPEMRKLIRQGTTLIVDRYSYSGVAFSTAKADLSEDWCWEQEVGLPRPDLVLFLELPIDKAADRDGFGDELYEKLDFQKKVYDNYHKMIDSTWKVIDADKDRDAVSKEMLKHIRKTIKEVKNKDLLSFEVKKKNSTPRKRKRSTENSRPSKRLVPKICL